MRDLNFVLRSEVFMNSDGQLQVSHLILGCTTIYKTWQPFNHALLVDNPLLSYIDVQHANLLPLRLTVGESRDLGSRYTITEDLISVRDDSVELVSQS